MAMPTEQPVKAPATGTSTVSLRIALVVCFLDEADHLPDLLSSLEAQTRRPDQLLLVDDGSSDGSAEIAHRFARGAPYAAALRRPPRPPARDRLAGAPELRAFQWAVPVLGPWDVVAKLDGDISFNPRLLETLEQRLLADPALGIAGCYLSVPGTDGSLVRETSPPDHVRGATKFYRRACYEQIAPIPPILGWDTIDEIAARMHGFRTQTFELPGGDSVHMRPTASHDGALRGYRRLGACAWGYGAHPLHVLLGASARLRRRPRLLGGANYAFGWARAALRRAPRAERAVRAHGHTEQLARISSLLRWSRV
jgi:hypothetical protein